MQNKPHTWQTVGHLVPKKLLERQLWNKTVAQSYIFLGPEGVGKRTLAEEFAESIALNATEVVRFNCEGVGMEELRTLLAQVALKPASGGKQVFILDKADTLNQSCSNALLKTLEEPNKSAVFILVAGSYSLPSTIVSRCQIVHFGKLSREELESLVKRYSLELSSDMLATAQGSAGLLMRFAREPDFWGQQLVWRRELHELLSASVAVRVVRSQQFASEEVEQLNARLTNWLSVLVQELSTFGANARQLSVILEAWQRMRKNANRKLVMEYVCLNI